MDSDLFWQALALFEAFLGAGLGLFLSIVLYSQRNVRPAGRPVWLFVVSFGIWHVAAFFIDIHPPSMGHEIEYIPIWRGVGYGAIAAGYVMAAWLCRLGWNLGERWLAVILAASCAGSAVYLPVPYLTITPPFFLSCFLYARNSFGLLISRRSLFALGLGMSAALYLTAVRWIALGLERKFGAAGWLVEAALVLWAGILWIPIYAGISRFLSRRVALLTEFSRTVIEEAALILDLDRRMDFFVQRLGARLMVPQVIVAYGGRTAQIVKTDVATGQMDVLLQHAESAPADLYYTSRLEPGAARSVLESLHCNYFFPLRYEHRVTGALLLDTRPHVHLDDNEEVLVALTPQISQSLETCRLLAERIGLEHLASLGKMSATIAHEIKNPLAAIKAIAQVMQEDEAVAANYAEDLRFIASETDRLDRSMRQLLGFSRPSPQLQEDVDLTELVRATRNALDRQASVEGVQFEARIADGVRHTQSNRELWQQVVLNLLLNALQASPRGSTVTVSLDGAPRFAVADEGPGIPPELRERVFDPFFTTKQQGTGLGLAIVRKNVRALGGEVRIECPASGGTRVTVEF